jgi:hypothetical protein
MLRRRESRQPAACGGIWNTAGALGNRNRGPQQTITCLMMGTDESIEKGPSCLGDMLQKVE